jgi:exodeoxyribonuclease V gamma subunit
LTLYLYRTNQTERLAEAICGVLRTELPSDPFVSYPVVVGSLGMERWLRHEIATRLEIASGIAFPFPRQSLAGAARWLLEGAEGDGCPFWELGDANQKERQRWEPGGLAFALIPLLRVRRGNPAFAHVDRYLREGQAADDGGTVDARELLFAAEVASVLDRIMHERPLAALDWSRDPAGAPAEHVWLATLLCDLGVDSNADSPASLHKRLLALSPCDTGRSMCIFGLSTMGPGDRDRLAAISRSMNVHAFVMTPTRSYFQYTRTRREIAAARKSTATDREATVLEGELALDNPVLASLGAPSRDLQHWFEVVTYEGDLLECSLPGGNETPTMLERFQRWVLEADPVPDTPMMEWRADDSSLSAHATYGAMRQCEVLRDELLAMLAQDETLTPKDILVMTPDIETFAPLVAAVFSRTGVSKKASGQGRVQLPVSIADLGLRRTNPLAQVLLSVFQSARTRLKASWIADFIALEPVRLRWKIHDEDLADLQDMIRTSGMRWGADAEERYEADQPRLDQNTARFAMERLALGVLMPDEAPLHTIAASDSEFGPAVPMQIDSRERVRRVGQLISIVRTVNAHRRTLRTSASAAEWYERLTCVLDDLCEVTPQTSWQRARVDSALAGFYEMAASLEETQLAAAAVHKWLMGDFELPQRGDRAITGAVQVCAFEPMRSVPFRVVALLGMDDKSFPRGSTRRAWDPMQERLPGERDRREIDRHLLLEALLSARQRLLIFWSGHDTDQGREQPAAVPVEELLEMWARLTGSSRDEIVRQHPLQPWSADNFISPRRSYDQVMARAAKQVRDIQQGVVVPKALGLVSGGTDALPPESNPPQTLTLDEFARALAGPHKVLLKDRLGLFVTRDQDPIEDREPLELGGLNRWKLRDKMIAQIQQDPESWTQDQLVEAYGARMSGEGTLPLRAGGRRLLELEAGNSIAVVDNLGAVGGLCSAPLELSLPLPCGLHLVGRAEDVRERQGELLMQWHSASQSPNEAARLTGWIHLLVAVASGHPVSGARLVGYGSSAGKNRKGEHYAGGDFLLFDGDAASALAALDQLVSVWKNARRRPLPLFRRTSSAIANILYSERENLGSSATFSQMVQKASEAWYGNRFVKGDIEDPWIATFFVDYDPIDHLEEQGEDSLVGLATRVWVPVYKGLDQGKDLGFAWCQEEEP